MKEKVSRITLIVWAFLFLFAGFALSAPGGNVPLGILMVVFAIPSLIAGPRRYRVLGGVALVVAVVATVADYNAGKRFRIRLEHNRVHAEAQKKDQGGEQSAAPLPSAPAGPSEGAR